MAHRRGVLAPVRLRWQAAVLGFVRDLRGLLFACTTKSAYAMMFEWIYPTYLEVTRHWAVCLGCNRASLRSLVHAGGPCPHNRLQLIVRAVEIFHADAPVAVPALKFMVSGSRARGPGLAGGLAP